MDQAPRELSVQQLQLLPHFAEMVVRHLEKDRKALLQQAAAGRLLTRSIECVSEVQPRRLLQLTGTCVLCIADIESALCGPCGCLAMLWVYCKRWVHDLSASGRRAAEEAAKHVAGLFLS